MHFLTQTQNPSKESLRGVRKGWTLWKEKQRCGKSEKQQMYKRKIFGAILGCKTRARGGCLRFLPSWVSEYLTSSLGKEGELNSQFRPIPSRHGVQAAGPAARLATSTVQSREKMNTHRPVLSSNFHLSSCLGPKQKE